MGAAHGLPVTGCHPERAESPHGFRTSSTVAGEGVEPSFPSYQDGVLNHWTTRRSASDSCGIRTQPDWRERPATSPDVQRAVQKHRPSPFPRRSHLAGSVGGTNILHSSSAAELLIRPCGAAAVLLENNRPGVGLTPGLRTAFADSGCVSQIPAGSVERAACRTVGLGPFGGTDPADGTSARWHGPRHPVRGDHQSFPSSPTRRSSGCSLKAVPS